MKLAKTKSVQRNEKKMLGVDHLFGKHLEIAFKIKFDPAIPHLGICTREIEISIHRDIYI